MALGEMLIKPRELYEQYTLRSLTNAIKGFYRRQDRLRMQSWDQVRFNTFHLLNIHVDPKHKMHHYTDLVKFPWDEPPKPQTISRDVFKSILKNQ